MSATATRIPPPAGTEGHWYGTDIDQAIDFFSATVVLASALDPITTELVRLRCARYHDCRLCRSLRYEPALRAGLSETVNAKIDDYEASDLEERYKTALRLTDAVILDPRSVDPALRESLHEHFTDEQIAELMLDIVKWSFQKVLVAFQLDVPVRPGLSLLAFDEQGNPSIGESLDP